MIEFAEKEGETTMRSCGRDIVISDPMYEDIINDLIKAGTILTKCMHDTHVAGPCELCLRTWEGCVDNANKVRSGKATLRRSSK